MTLQELLSALGNLVETKLSGPEKDIEVAGISADSRKVEPGFLFVGVPGSQVDGARFVTQTFSQGAAAALVSTDSQLPDGWNETGRPVIRCSNVHLALAKLAGHFYPANLKSVGAVTGTNGKTSIASFLRQIWAHDGKLAANIGTIGIEGPSGSSYGGLTTPDPVGLMQSAGKLAEEGVTHLALEASSHGLEQCRLDGLTVDVGAFTNLTRDHLDYHKTLEAYRDAKALLYSRLVKEDGTAIINLDDPFGAHFLSVAKARGLHCVSVGSEAGADLRIEAIKVDGLNQKIVLSGIWGDRECLVPLVGTFQASNALVAGLMAYATGVDADVVIDAIAQLKGACGRMELVGKVGDDAPIYVDYSHTPDSLATALQALRPFTKGRLLTVFGAGGDRDPGKRPMMGKAAEDFADYAFVTDDNPRSEDPALIRSAIMTAVTNGEEVDGRQEAIDRAVAMMQSGDVLVVAGKGHETGQTVKGEVLPFSDHDAVASALEKRLQGEAS